MTIAQKMIPEYTNESALTRKVLEIVPEDKWDYAPHEKSMKLGRLASHIAEMLKWGVDILTTEEMSFDPKTHTAYVAENRQALLSFYDEYSAKFAELLSTTDDAEMLKTWSLKANGHTLFEMPRVAVIRVMVFNHIIHHRAQLGVYLRMHDIPLPAIYGPSADENVM